MTDATRKLLLDLADAVAQWRDELRKAQANPCAAETRSSFGDEVFEVEWGRLLEQQIHDHAGATANDVRLAVAHRLGDGVGTDFQRQLNAMMESAADYSPELNRGYEPIRQRLRKIYTEAGARFVAEGYGTVQELHAAVDERGPIVGTLKLNRYVLELYDAEEDRRCDLAGLRYRLGIKPAEDFIAYLKSVVGLLDGEPEAPPKSGDILTQQEAASYLKVHPKTIREYAEMGMPEVRLGNSPRYIKAAIWAWMNRRDEQ